MPNYVDGFVLPMPTKNLPAYRKMAQKASKIWREHGALEYRECVADDMDVKFGLPFPRGHQSESRTRRSSSPGSSTNHARTATA